ncbi:hypothetical protein DYU11_12405 [Fibrisoma montanum]|uniref:DUF2147 domain-containing protein n=1 Tax=Fibrisoma montanum TaxID=2305895 RepID=A0A418MBM4_9BACT|nr:DUF5991 domain-containing protein [Fibrisoma montanum]RIV23768.1 hypothetical protein DYU11_12405 [Fibrisoma montanum]
MVKFGLIVGVLLASVGLFSAQKTDGWLGTWSGEHREGVTYTITVRDKYKGLNLCEVHAEGIQTHYTLECVATGHPATLNVYFRSVKDGAFYARDRVNINQPLFSLKRDQSRVLWRWQQIFEGGIVVQKTK